HLVFCRCVSDFPIEQRDSRGVALRTAADGNRDVVRAGVDGSSIALRNGRPTVGFLLDGAVGVVLLGRTAVPRARVRSNLSRAAMNGGSERASECEEDEQGISKRGVALRHAEKTPGPRRACMKTAGRAFDFYSGRDRMLRTRLESSELRSPSEVASSSSSARR